VTPEQAREAAIEAFDRWQRYPGSGLKDWPQFLDSALAKIPAEPAPTKLDLAHGQMLDEIVSKVVDFAPTTARPRFLRLTSGTLPLFAREDRVESIFVNSYQATIIRLASGDDCSVGESPEAILDALGAEVVVVEPKEAT
jgi:hypothetical protein